MKTDKEIIKLAKDIREGHVFGSWQIPESHIQSLLPMVFMALAFIEEKHLKEYEELDVLHFYEYYSESGPRSVNGYPMFFSHDILTRRDVEKIDKVIKKLDEAEAAAQTQIDDVLNPPPPLFSQDK